jgi:DNA polymerase III alpha subunit
VDDFNHLAAREASRYAPGSPCGQTLHRSELRGRCATLTLHWYKTSGNPPSIRKNELKLLAEAGAFNWTGKKHDRRTALWRAERAGQNVGPLFQNIPDEFEIDASSPLLTMTVDERLVADFFTTGFTIGPHPMSYHRAQMDKAGVIRAADLKWCITRPMAVRPRRHRRSTPHRLP